MIAYAKGQREVTEAWESETDDAAPIEVSRALSVFRRTLGDTIVGVYLYGSYAAGGLRPQSDIDLFVLIAQPLKNVARQTLNL
jgi:predicted nucleotidyltransferase